MSKYKYDFCFDNNTHLTFNSNEDIDFDIISNTAITFENAYINMRNVNFILKKEITDDSVSGDNSSES